MMIKKYWILSSIIGCIVLLLVACTHQVTIDHLVTDRCSAPCWQNLEPGITTLDKVNQLAIDSEQINEESLEYSGTLMFEEGLVNRYEFLQSDGRRGNIIVNSESEIVLKIGIGVFGNDRLERILEILGEPNYVFVWLTDYSVSCYEIHFFFLERGVHAISERQCVGPDELNNVTSLTEIIWFNFVERSANINLETFLLTLYEPSLTRTQRMITESQVWQGYGFYPDAQE